MCSVPCEVSVGSVKVPLVVPSRTLVVLGELCRLMGFGEGTLTLPSDRLRQRPLTSGRLSLANCPSTWDTVQPPPTLGEQFVLAGSP
jgi:hypothetical protein